MREMVEFVFLAEDGKTAGGFKTTPAEGTEFVPGEILDFEDWEAYVPTRYRLTSEIYKIKRVKGSTVFLEDVSA